MSSSILICGLSIDLKKAFDRVEHNVLFRALKNHGLQNGYCQLLRELYRGQQGVLSDEISFEIDRGVRQGDVLSPMLFNCALENAIAEWKGQLREHGFALDNNPATERLTNVRFADDLLIFAKSTQEAVQMIESLVRVLETYGLELNVKKTKMLSTEVEGAEAMYVDTEAGFVEVVAEGRVHKYLGRAWSGCLRERGDAAVNHRIACAWTKFRSLEQTLTNRNVSIGLRLKLFDATVTPALLYSLETCPLTNRLLEKVDVVQRRMLRKIVGWVMSGEEEDWTERGRRMKERMERALLQHPVDIWSETVEKRKGKLLERLHSDDVSPLVRRTVVWDPRRCGDLNRALALRGRGRPRCRWSDGL